MTLLCVAIALIGLISSAVFANVCGPNRVLLHGEAGYSLRGAVTVNGTPAITQAFVPQIHSFKRHGLVLWGSWAGGAQATGQLETPPFPCPPILGLLIAGQPSALTLERLDTGEHRFLRIGPVGDKWQQIDWGMPIEWYHRPVRLIVDDQGVDSTGWLGWERGGWFGVSSPLQVSFSSFLTHQLPVLGESLLYPVCFAFFFVPGLLLASFTTQYWKINPGFVVMLASVASSLIGYSIFWIYFFNQNAGIVASCSYLLASVGIVLYAPLRQRLIKTLRPETRRLLWLMLLVGIAYLATLYAINTGAAPEYLSEFRFFGVFQPDNVLPKIFADRLYVGARLSPLFIGWLSSDRPPLQTGLVLVQRPLSAFNQFQLGFHYQMLGLVAQCVWVAATWSLCRVLGLSKRQLAIVFTVCIFSGFFLFNSIYVWPKLLAAAFVVFALALLLDALMGQRHLSTAEMGIAAAAIALGLLAHASVIFTLPGIGLLLLRYYRRLRPQVLIGGCLVGLLLLAPWSAYQKFYDPPGDYLAKYHIAGDHDFDSLSLFQAFLKTYSHTKPTDIARNKWDNLTMLFDGPRNRGQMLGVPIFDKTDEYQTARAREYIHLFRALGMLNVSWFVWLWTRLTKRIRTVFDIRKIDWVLGISLLSLGVWVLAMFGPGTTFIHQGSYATVMLLFTSLAALLAVLPRWIVYAVCAFQIVVFMMIWIISTTFDVRRVMITPLNVLELLLAGIATIGIVWLLYRLAHDRDDPPTVNQ